MDPRWLPWCWGAGAIGCAAVFFGVQPWQAEWRRGVDLVWKYPASWLLPAGLLALDALPGLRPPPGGLSGQEGKAGGWVAEALLEALHGWTFGAGPALLLALLLAFNLAGMRRGMLKGVESVTGGSGRGFLVLFTAGALALLADLALRGRGVPVVWHGVVTTLAVPLVGGVAAIILAGLLLLAETMVRAPGKMEGVRWLESAAAHGARLWPWGLAHGLGWWFSRWLPLEAMTYLKWGVVVGGLGFCFAPLVFLHVRRTAEAREGWQRAVDFWAVKGWQPLAWVMVAGILFFPWYLAGQGLGRMAAEAPRPLQIGLAAVFALGQIGLTVMALGAWVALRLAGVPPPARPRRSRKATPS